MAATLKDKRILVVDDDPDIVTAISTVLSDMGATVDSAGDGNTAVSLAEEKEPDLVILDIMLPQKSGFLVLERIRQTPRHLFLMLSKFPYHYLSKHLDI